MPVPSVRRLVGATLAAGLTAALAANPGLAPAAGSPPGHPAADPLAPLDRPFVMPGFKEQEFNGALLVGEGETRFSVSIDLLTKDGKVINENMVPSIQKVGPIATDGSYFNELSTDDRVLTEERLGGLRATIAHPESWTEEEVATAKAQLPALQAKYDAMQAGKRNVVVG